MINDRLKALEKSGLSFSQAAKKVRVSEKYLKSKLRHGDMPYCLAERLSWALDCRIDVFY